MSDADKRVEAFKSNDGTFYRCHFGDDHTEFEFYKDGQPVFTTSDQLVALEYYNNEWQTNQPANN